MSFSLVTLEFSQVVYYSLPTLATRCTGKNNILFAVPGSQTIPSESWLALVRDSSHM